MKCTFYLLIILLVIITSGLLLATNQHTINISLDIFNTKNPIFIIQSPLYVIILKSMLIGSILSIIIILFGKYKYKKLCIKHKNKKLINKKNN